MEKILNGGIKLLKIGKVKFNYKAEAHSYYEYKDVDQEFYEQYIKPISVKEEN